jgi:hypothetical protein
MQEKINNKNLNNSKNLDKGKNIKKILINKIKEKKSENAEGNF